MIWQKEIRLNGFRRGAHLITDLIIRELPDLPSSGLLHLFIQHTSAGLTINENADPSVRFDLEQFLNLMVPENSDYFSHTLEGSDDMPAHIKSCLVGNQITIPVKDGRLALGTWQGIYFCEFRNHGGSRRLILTLYS